MDTPTAQAPAVISSVSKDPTVPTKGPDIDLQAEFARMVDSDSGTHIPAEHDPSKPFGWVDYALIELMSPRTRDDNGRQYREFDLLPDEMKARIGEIIARRFGARNRDIAPHELTYVREAIAKRGIDLTIVTPSEIDTLKSEVARLSRLLSAGKIS